MTSARPQPSRLDPGELIAAIPALLRYSPTESMVLIGFTATPTRLTVRCVMRLDLPSDDAPVEALSAQVSDAVIAQEIDRVVMVIIADGEQGDAGLPHQAVRCAVLRAFADAHVEVAEVLWAARIEPGLPWRSGLDPQRTGTLPDPGSSPVTLATVLDGVPIYASRADLVAQLAADPLPMLLRRAARLRELPPVEPESAVRLLRELLDRIAANPTEEVVLDEDTLVRAAHALTHGEVREAGLACALTEWAGAAERLWTVLTRATPAAVVTHPASLLATAVYLRGDGTLAQIALDVALAADPDYPLALAVRSCLNRAIPPEQFRQVLLASLDAVARDRLATLVDAPR